MVKIKADDQLARAIFALDDAATSTQDAMRQSAAESIDRVWSPALASAAGTSPERKLLATGAGSSVEAGRMTLIAGNGPTLTGGLTEDGWYAIEFGMTPVQIYSPNRRKKIRIAGSGREMSVQTRIWVGRNLRARNELGYVIFPTIRQHGPRFVAAWIYGLIGKWRGTPFDVKKG